MALVTIRDLTIRFRGPALLDGVDCLIEAGQHIGLLGRNGAGKTTLLKLLAGELEPDHGSVECGGRVALLQQDVPQDLHGDVASVVRTGVAHGLDHDDGSEWQIDHKVDQILSRMELDSQASVAELSSGMKRRVLLARALVDQPDLLLLDEPTNHLDIDAIGWLETFLARYAGTLIFITHDRQFLRRLASRILEIDRGKIFDWTCDYETFLKRKQEALAAEEKQNTLFDKRLAEEEVWIRQGIKARRTRNEGRVRALEELRLIRGERRTQVGSSNLKIHEGARSGTLVVKAEDISFGHRAADQDPVQVLKGFSTTILRGDKVGIIGRNGAGKTTLLRLLLGKLQPQTGSVRLGTNVQVAYFDQLRAQLDDEKTVQEDVADGYQTIDINGNSRHVLGYLQDFLFTPERARTPIKRLSGGERNRVLLAKLFAKTANVIVLDEPTNDLDAETLEMLEARLVSFSGTLLVVSHDREFLNNVVTSCIVFETDRQGNDVVAEYVGGYDDWQRQRRIAIESATNDASGDSEQLAGPASDSQQGVDSGPKPERRKLTFKESQELDSLPGRIERIESEIAAKHDEMSEPGFYQQDGTQIAEHQSQLNQLDVELVSAYSRWEKLEQQT